MKIIKTIDLFQNIAFEIKVFNIKIIKPPQQFILTDSTEIKEWLLKRACFDFAEKITNMQIRKHDTTLGHKISDSQLIAVNRIKSEMFELGSRKFCLPLLDFYIKLKRTLTYLEDIKPTPNCTIYENYIRFCVIFEKFENLQNIIN